MQSSPPPAAPESCFTIKVSGRGVDWDVDAGSTEERDAWMEAILQARDAPAPVVAATVVEGAKDAPAVVAATVVDAAGPNVV